MRLYVDVKIALLLLIPTAVIAMFLKSWLGGYGVPGVITIVFTNVFMVMLATRLKA